MKAGFVSAVFLKYFWNDPKYFLILLYFRYIYCTKKWSGASICSYYKRTKKWLGLYIFPFTSATYWIYIISTVTRTERTTEQTLPAKSKLWVSTLNHFLLLFHNSSLEYFLSQKNTNQVNKKDIKHCLAF